MMLHLHYFVSL